MIRTLLASPWLPLFYWAAAVVAMVCRARQEASRPDLRYQEFEAAMTATSPQVDFSSLPPLPAKVASASVRSPPRFWDPEIFVFQRQNLPLPTQPTETGSNKAPVAADSRAQAVASTTMLSIRLDSPGSVMAKNLTIRCRTSAAISNAHGRTVTIHGVVTQEVVSSAGKILIMAGSRVVGSGILDPENGRIKSDGLWSIFLDDTELKVEAELLDRPSGLLGILGQEVSSEDLALPRETMTRASRSVLLPKNSPFVLEVHGEILLRDLKENEVSN